MPHPTGVFPAYAGMFRPPGWSGYFGDGFPRIRGDVPRARMPRFGVGEFSPHTRGCSSCLILLIPKKLVFPAHAGMFRSWRCAQCLRRGFPRTRGDVPNRGFFRHKWARFSPHTRGCSVLFDQVHFLEVVFLAHAGMFLSRISVILRPSCFPRICGDVPHQPRSGGKRCRFSPHTRGCSASGCHVSPFDLVFPAYAGIFQRQDLQ